MPLLLLISVCTTLLTETGNSQSFGEPHGKVQSPYIRAHRPHSQAQGLYSQAERPYNQTQRLGVSLALAVTQWPVTGPVRGLVFISHGYAEHLRPYYDRFGHACGSMGLLCWGHDHVGHGLSPGARTEVAAMEEYTGPLVAECRRKQRQHPGVPLFILGHSMGGLIALAADLANPGLFSGLALTAPLIISGDDNPVNRVIGALGSKLCSSCSISFIRLDIEDVTKSQAWRNYIQADPLFYQGGIKFGPAQVLVEATDQLLGQLEQVVSPLLVLHGQADKLVLVEGSRQLVRRAGSRDKQLVEVTGARHHLLLDQPARVQGTILNWIIDRIP